MTRRAAALATITACVLAVAGPATVASAAGAPGEEAAGTQRGKVPLPAGLPRRGMFLRAEKLSPIDSTLICQGSSAPGRT